MGRLSETGFEESTGASAAPTGITEPTGITAATGIAAATGITEQIVALLFQPEIQPPWCHSFAEVSVMLFDSQSKLDAARSGDDEAKGELLNRFRPYLNVIAQRLLDDRVQGRLDYADVVQATYLEASRDFRQFRGDTVESFLAWLRNILRNNVSTAHQEHLVTQKRSARREVSFGGTGSSDGSQGELGHVLPAETSTPSQRVMKNEAAVVLAACMDQLPDSQREAIRMRYLEGMPLKEISERMGKSEMAVAGLLKRGLRGLRDELKAIQTGLSSLM